MADQFFSFLSDHHNAAVICIHPSKYSEHNVPDNMPISQVGKISLSELKHLLKLLERGKCT